MVEIQKFYCDKLYKTEFALPLFIDAENKFHNEMPVADFVKNCKRIDWLFDAQLIRQRFQVEIKDILCEYLGHPHKKV